MEVIIILVAGLLILGPKRLPEAARQVGKAMSELRRVSTGLQTEMRDAFESIDVPADPPPARPQELPPPPPPAPAPPVQAEVQPGPATPADAEVHPSPDDLERD
jgi:sec-independent protein translocase protein TatB